MNHRISTIGKYQDSIFVETRSSLKMMLIRRNGVLFYSCYILSTIRHLCHAFPARTPIWEQQWLRIAQMRESYPAAVDTMGADALAHRGTTDGANFRFQTLIATMLSPQTRDEQTTIAYENLKSLVKPADLRASSLSKHSVEEIESAIKMVSFFKVKAKNILEASQICATTYKDDIPTSIEDLLKFKGVGPKIAYLTFTIAHGQTLGICVDTHVHRITNRLGWVDTWGAKSNGPEKTRIALQKVLPQERWGEVNGLIVGFGQTICAAKAPKCDQCLLTESCKFYQAGKKMPSDLVVS
jgi:endonuclease-3